MDSKSEKKLLNKMSLLKKFDNKGLSVIEALVIGAATGLAVVIFGLNYAHNKEIKKNLAPNAIFSKYLNVYNEKNKDGKYEVIIKYEKDNVSLPVLKIESDKDFNWSAAPIQLDYKKELYGK